MINKTYIKYPLLLVFLLAFVSCSKDFLDEPKNTNGISGDNAFSNRGTVEAVISGMMRNYRRQWDDNLTDGVSTSRPDTGGIYAMYFARTLKGNDIIQRPTWFRFDYAHENREATFRRVNFTWFFNYQSINYANVLIDGVTKSNTLTDAEKAEFIAVGKSVRAYHYFQLALEFAPNYNNDRSIERLPLYTTPTEESVDGNPPVALNIIFEQIINDLKESIPNLPSTNNALGKSFIHKEFGNVVLARVLQVTQDDWNGVSQAAQAAYGNDASDAVVSSNWGEGFDDLSDQEWLWGHFQDDVETNFFWMAPPVFTDHENLSFRATYVNPNFVEEFSNTDVRNTFKDLYGVSAETPWREFVTTKFNFDFESDVALMRKSEMVLADAEAQYHLGNIPQAQNLLFTLQSERDSNATMSGTTGQALLDEILLERRKELYGEMGVEWFDAKRYELSINRDPEHRVVVNVPANSDLFFLNIPQIEIDANINIDGSINN